MAKGLLILRTLTPTHPGAGTSVGAIDLMLQREVTTNFPFIQGSSLKGAIRSYLHPKEEKQVLDKMFGPRDNHGSNLSKGAIIISDASLLFYPVRSLKGLYALVTCPEILRRLKMPHIGLNIPADLLKWDDKGKVRALKLAKSKYEVNGRVYLEDLNFSVEILTEDNFSWVNKLGFENESKKDILNRLFIVHDDVFQYFVKFATMVISRNRIDYGTGIVQRGALWTEEHLPPETYLFSYLEDNDKKVDEESNSLARLRKRLDKKVIHLGGDETVGKGFVELRFTALNSKSKVQLNSLTQEAKNG